MGMTKNQATTATSNQGRRTKKEELTPAAMAKATDNPSVSTPAAQKPVSKQQQLAALLVCDEGATLDQMVEATGWLRHTTRAALLLQSFEVQQGVTLAHRLMRSRQR